MPVEKNNGAEHTQLVSRRVAAEIKARRRAEADKELKEITLGRPAAEVAAELSAKTIIKFMLRRAYGT